MLCGGHGASQQSCGDAGALERGTAPLSLEDSAALPLHMGDGCTNRNGNSTLVHLANRYGPPSLLLHLLGYGGGVQQRLSRWMEVLSITTLAINACVTWCRKELTQSILHVHFDLFLCIAVPTFYDFIKPSCK